MPLISDIDKSKKTNSRFQKKSYRPWDDELPQNNKQNNSTIQQLSSTDKDYINPSKIEFTNSNIDQNMHLVDISPPFTTCLPELNLNKELRKLFGAQKIIIKYLLEQVEENNNEYLVTKSIAMEEFTLACKLPPNTIKGMLQKLKTKKLIYTYENKPGRGGYARYNFTQEVYLFFLKNLNNI